MTVLRLVKSVCMYVSASFKSLSEYVVLNCHGCCCPDCCCVFRRLHVKQIGSAETVFASCAEVSGVVASMTLVPHAGQDHAKLNWPWLRSTR